MRNYLMCVIGVRCETYCCQFQPIRLRLIGLPAICCGIKPSLICHPKKEAGLSQWLISIMCFMVTIVEDCLTITNRTFMDLGAYQTGRIGLIEPVQFLNL